MSTIERDGPVAFRAKTESGRYPLNNKKTIGGKEKREVEAGIFLDLVCTGSKCNSIQAVYQRKEKNNGTRQKVHHHVPIPFSS
jgi:hypothetical protein